LYAAFVISIAFPPIKLSDNSVGSPSFRTAAIATASKKVHEDFNSPMKLKLPQSDRSATLISASPQLMSRKSSIVIINDDIDFPQRLSDEENFCLNPKLKSFSLNISTPTSTKFDDPDLMSSIISVMESVGDIKDDDSDKVRIAVLTDK
jgi:hypothetical protein